MEATEVKKLKLNARRIHNTLLSNNKQIRKLRLSESSFLKNQETQEKRTLKEQSIEKPSGVRKALSSIKDKMMSGPMSIFDKIKELFGIILIGFLVNALPGIIKKIKKFFDENPGIINAIKETFKILGNLGYGLIKIVNSLTPKDQQKLTAEKDEVDKGINSLDGELNIIDRLMTNLFNVFGAPTPQPTPTFQNTGGYGKYAPPSTQVKTPAPTPKPAPSSTQQSSPPQSTPTQTVPVQKFSKGGTVQGFQGGGTVQVGKGGGEKKKVTSPGTFARPGGTAKGKKARESVNAFEDFETNTKTSGFLLKVQDENNKSFNKLTKNLSIFGDLIRGKKDKKDDGPGPDNRLPRKDEPPVVIGGTSDFWLLSLISLYENSNPQGAADVAQSIYNRMANRGQSARQVILAEDQYQPVRKFGGYSEWDKVVDRETAIAHIKNYPGNSASVKRLDVVAQALLNPSKQSEAAKFVGILPDFRNEGYESSNDEMTNDKSRLNHTFGFNRGGSRGKITKPAQVPSFVEADVLTQYTPTELIGTNTAFQGKTGRVTGEHFHIGPSQLLNPKTLLAENNGTSQGLIDARQAAFRVAKALIARKQPFTFTNAGITINPNERITDQQLRNYILSEQNAHMSRSMGSSWGGVDIYAHKSGMDVPIPVGEVVFHGDGFGYRAILSGTKGFIAHLTKGSKATPLDKIKKSEAPPKQEAVVKQTDLDRLKTVINSNPGSGEEVKIPGVGTYVRGKDGLFAVDKYFDESGNRITVKEFYDRLKKVKKENNQISSSSISTSINQIDPKNLKSSTDESSSVLLATVQQPYIIEREVVRYIGGNSEYISESGGNVNMEQLMALRLV